MEKHHLWITNLFPGAGETATKFKGQTESTVMHFLSWQGKLIEFGGVKLFIDPRASLRQRLSLLFPCFARLSQAGSGSQSLETLAMRFLWSTTKSFARVWKRRLCENNPPWIIRPCWKACRQQKFNLLRVETLNQKATLLLVNKQSLWIGSSNKKVPQLILLV